MKTVAVLALRAYRVGLWPLTLGACRYYPTCSRYSEEAIHKHGFLKGAWLTGKRLARCRPFGGRGYDPVP